MLQTRSASARGPWTVCAALVLGLLPAALMAHPGSGIVVDRLGQVYFIDTGAGVWKIDTRGVLVKVTAPRFHWLTLDANDRFARARLPSGPTGDITRVGSTPTLLVASDYPLAIGPDGNLYYPSRRAGGAAVDLLRVEPAGRSSILATVSLPSLNGLAAAPDGSLYYTENRAIRRVSPKGEVSTVVAGVALSSCARIPGNDPNDPLLRGLAVDSKGTVFVAASGCGSLLKVTPNGVVSTVLQLDGPWSPTAVALHGDIYVLEYLHTAVEDRLQWLPRVRKISADGKSAVIASVTR
jgi:SMP-30/gluconolaconase/LRE-like protein